MQDNLFTACCTGRLNICLIIAMTEVKLSVFQALNAASVCCSCLLCLCTLKIKKSGKTSVFLLLLSCTFVFPVSSFLSYGVLGFNYVHFCCKVDIITKSSMEIDLLLKPAPGGHLGTTHLDTNAMLSVLKTRWRTKSDIQTLCHSQYACSKVFIYKSG